MILRTRAEVAGCGGHSAGVLGHCSTPASFVHGTCARPTFRSSGGPFSHHWQIAVSYGRERFTSILTFTKETENCRALPTLSWVPATPTRGRPIPMQVFLSVYFTSGKSRQLCYHSDLIYRVRSCKGVVVQRHHARQGRPARSLPLREKSHGRFLRWRFHDGGTEDTFPFLTGQVLVTRRGVFCATSDVENRCREDRFDELICRSTLSWLTRLS